MSIASAAPAKRFFVEMLVRDIELVDAILDLLDNCVDGAMRKVSEGGGPADRDRPYDGFWAKISFDKDSFRITDNCGGIELELAKTSAFRLGRKDEHLDEDLPTVGLYGIGMKRALFKLGANSLVRSAHHTSYFEVAITPEWLADDLNWQLELNEDAKNFDHLQGTDIAVTSLRDGISRAFAADSFESDFVRAVEAYYGYIIEKGFAVEINGAAMESKKIKLLFGENVGGPGGPAIAPYIYRREKAEDGVEILLTVGLYRPLPSDDDEEQQLEGRASSEHAGWTIICNDRVVLYADKTRVTGWGEAGVPGYHTQFTSIAGVVIFKSTDPSLLPLTTTKRGVDGNSDLYLQVKDFMREGTKVFTDYTNRWKKRAEDRRRHQENSRAILPEVAATEAAIAYSQVRKPIGGEKSFPNLPTPGEKTEAWIRYVRPITEIETLSSRLYGHAAAKPSEVGEQCFVRVLAEEE